MCLSFDTSFYNFIPLLFLGSSTVCRKPLLNFSHCSLNHSSIGCPIVGLITISSDRKYFSGQQNLSSVTFSLAYNLKKLMKHVCYKSAIPVVKAANNWLDYVKSLILQLDQNFSDKFFLLEYPIKESFNNLMLTVLKNILP